MTDIQNLFLREDQKAWFLHDRFGMFIHWGIYSLAARHEWVKSREEIDELPPDAVELTVDDIMTPEVFTVGEETTVSEIAGRMIASHVHRLLVTREDRVVGIISTESTSRVSALR